MDTLDRRSFVQLSAGALLAAASKKVPGAASAPSISSRDGAVEVKAANYSWAYTQADSAFRLRDSRNRLMASGKLQPAVVVAPQGDPARRICTGGKAVGYRVEPGRIVFDYDGVNGASRLSSAWRFDELGIWMEPIEYQASAGHDVVSLHYFAGEDGWKSTPTLHSSYLVAPGLLSGSPVSPIVSEYVHLDENVWLGRGSFIPGLSQQWGLPVHYFCGFSIDGSAGQRNMYTDGRSDAFACGLADLPGGDLFLQLYEGKSGPGSTIAAICGSTIAAPAASSWAQPGSGPSRPTTTRPSPPTIRASAARESSAVTRTPRARRPSRSLRSSAPGACRWTATRAARSWTRRSSTKSTGNSRPPV